MGSVLITDNNTFVSVPLVTRERRSLANGHAGATLWFTGLSGAGKSTLAHEIEIKLFEQGYRTYVLDGDNIRRGLCADLDFSPQSRSENLRRSGEVAKLFVDAGVIVLATFISPMRADRAKVRARFAAGEFIEIHCDCSLEICEARDVKGLYARARAGEISEFTGISSAYESPDAADIRIDTGALSIEQSVELVLEHLRLHSEHQAPER